jgi:hypothetical protein
MGAGGSHASVALAEAKRSPGSKRSRPTPARKVLRRHRSFASSGLPRETERNGEQKRALSSPRLHLEFQRLKTVLQQIGAQEHSNPQSRTIGDRQRCHAQRGQRNSSACATPMCVGEIRAAVESMLSTSVSASSVIGGSVRAFPGRELTVPTALPIASTSPPPGPSMIRSRRPTSRRLPPCRRAAAGGALALFAPENGHNISSVGVKRLPGLPRVDKVSGALPTDGLKLGIGAFNPAAKKKTVYGRVPSARGVPILLARPGDNGCRRCLNSVRRWQ